MSSKLVLRSLIEGNSFSKDIAIEKGSVSSFSGGIDDSTLFITFESYVVANRIYKLDFARNVSDIRVRMRLPTVSDEPLKFLHFFFFS